MLIISKTHTHEVGTTMHPPGVPFECPEVYALKKLAAGTAHAVTGDSNAKAQAPEGPATPAVRAPGPSTPPTGQARVDAIVGACLDLDEDRDELFMASGAPTTKALSDEAGFSVSAAERDVAWSEVCEADEDEG